MITVLNSCYGGDNVNKIVEYVKSHRAAEYSIVSTQMYSSITEKAVHAYAISLAPELQAQLRPCLVTERRQ